MALSTLRVPGLRSLLNLSRRPLLPVARLVSSAAATSRPQPAARPAGPSTLSRSLQSRLFSSSSTRRQLPQTTPPPSPGAGPGEAPPKTFGARLKHLFKTYGLYAVGVYFVIGLFDFGLSFAAINVLGAEHVRALAARVRNAVAAAVGWRQTPEHSQEGDGAGGNEGLWAMLGLAYLLHKTVFLPFRVGVTAAATPPIVHWLRARGWAGGAGTRRAVQEMRDKVRDIRNKDRD